MLLPSQNIERIYWLYDRLQCGIKAVPYLRHPDVKLSGNGRDTRSHCFFYVEQVDDVAVLYKTKKSSVSRSEFSRCDGHSIVFAVLVRDRAVCSIAMLQRVLRVHTDVSVLSEARASWLSFVSRQG